MYTLTKYGCIIRNADGASIPPDTANNDYVDYLDWASAGNTPNQPAPPTVEQLAAEIDAAFDAHIDSVAAQHGYKRAGVTPSASCIGYAGYPNPYQAEAIKFGQWVADCCALLIVERAKVVAGTRAMPTPTQAIAELPPMVW